MKKSNANQNVNLNLINTMGSNPGVPLQTYNNIGQFNNFNNTPYNNTLLTQDKKANIPRPNKFK